VPAERIPEAFGHAASRSAAGIRAALIYLDISAKLTLRIFRCRPLVVVTVAASGEPSFEVFLAAAIGHALARAARPIHCAARGRVCNL